MQGIDVHLDTNIGKRLSALGHTLTSLAGDEDEEFLLEPTDERLNVSMEDMSEFSGVSCKKYLLTQTYIKSLINIISKKNIDFCKVMFVFTGSIRKLCKFEFIK